MPVNPGQPNAWNLGRDCSFQITAPGGIPVDFPITEGSCKQEVKKVESRPLNGKPKFANIPDGWSGKFKFDRVGRNLDDLFAATELTYWTTGSLYVFSMMQTIQNPDGTISQYQFNELSVHFATAGDFTSDKKVDQEVEFRGPDRIKIQ